MVTVTNAFTCCTSPVRQPRAAEVQKVRILSVSTKWQRTLFISDDCASDKSLFLEANPDSFYHRIFLTQAWKSIFHFEGMFDTVFLDECYTENIERNADMSRLSGSLTLGISSSTSPQQF